MNAEHKTKTTTPHRTAQHSTRKDEIKSELQARNTRRQFVCTMNGACVRAMRARVFKRGKNMILIQLNVPNRKQNIEI